MATGMISSSAPWMMSTGTVTWVNFPQVVIGHLWAPVEHEGGEAVLAMSEELVKADSRIRARQGFWMARSVARAVPRERPKRIISWGGMPRVSAA